VNDDGVWMLGHVSEIHQMHFEIMEEEAEHIVGSLHRIALSELLSRSITSMWDWEMRTKNMFQHNALTYIRDVTSLSVGRVNRLMGCGYVTRKEVFDVFCLYHLKLTHWQPREVNYRF
jgi:hypothetical protein